MNQANLEFPAVHPFSLSIRHVKINAESDQNIHLHHIHSECEIYVNLSGDVSFMVEERIYPIARGDVVLTRPYEYHHCIYHSNALHEHLWILFSSEENERILPMFFNRERGENNKIVLSERSRERLQAACFDLLSGKGGMAGRYCAFFQILSLLDTGKAGTDGNASVPAELTRALAYANAHFAENLSIGRLAEIAFVSQNTLERKFKKHLGVTPYEYITEKRLSHALHLLLGGASVTDACDKSGFSDCSQFIRKFRRKFGATPLQYIRQRGL